MRLLIIGDLDGYFSKASQIAISKGATVKKATDTGSALTAIRAGNGADLIMIDIKQDIAGLLKSFALEHICIPVIACGIETDKEIAVKAIKDGAKEYIPLPPNEELIAAVFEAISKDDRKVIFQSQAMKNIIKIADQIASTNATVLITGKSGTGKEVLARYIHKKSNRADKPFISVNCAAIPENLLESELFGHEKGAFTGAIARRIGKFEESHNGTLLLDEISEIDLRLQAKLLRAIQEQEIDRVGGSKPIKLNLRIIATSNRNLSEEVATGKFREDLYFRLNIINLELPPLKERLDDIELFVGFFINKYCKSNGISQKRISESAILALKHYSWPGNIRELENTVYRAVLFASGEEITPEHLKLPQQLAKQQSAYIENLIGRSVKSVEKDLIMTTLKHFYGDFTEAANILGISLKELQNKIAIYEKEENAA